MWYDSVKSAHKFSTDRPCMEHDELFPHVGTIEIWFQNCAMNARKTIKKMCVCPHGGLSKSPKVIKGINLYARGVNTKQHHDIKIEVL